MIPCTSGTVAVYVANGRENHVPVEAWSDDGTTGYVANDVPEDAVRTALVPAHTLSGLGTFAGYAAGTKAVLPGTGWEIVQRHADGTVERYPALAFELDGYGYGRVLEVSGDGTVGVMSDDSEVRPVGGWPKITRSGRVENEKPPALDVVQIKPRPEGPRIDRERPERGPVARG